MYNEMVNYRIALKLETLEVGVSVLLLILPLLHSSFTWFCLLFLLVCVSPVLWQFCVPPSYGKQCIVCSSFESVFCVELHCIRNGTSMNAVHIPFSAGICEYSAQRFKGQLFWMKIKWWQFDWEVWPNNTEYLQVTDEWSGENWDIDSKR